MRHAAWLSITGVVVALALVVAAVPFVLPSEDVPAHKLAAAVIFVASYLALAVGKIPGLSIDRAGVALVGACLMVASGVLLLADAYKAIDSDTITLLLGMMIIVANLRLSGFFAVRQLGDAAHAPAAHAAGRRDRRVGCSVRFSGQRCDLSHLSTARAGPCALAQTQSPALSPCGGDGIECGLGRHHHVSW
jgi:hypothetical protein